MKIGLVYSPELDIGGVERHLLDLITFLHIHQIEVILFSNTSPTFKKQLTSHIQNGLEIYSWKTSATLNNLITTYQPDLLHFHSPDATLRFYRHQPETLNIPLIETRHLSYPDFFAGDQKTVWRKLRSAYFKEQERKINHALLTKCIFVSKIAWENAVLSGDIAPQNAVHIGNTVDFSKFQPTKTKQTKTNHQPVLICTSRLEEQKGQVILIEALRKISLPWELWLVGSGTQDDVLKKLAFKHHLERKIRFWGYQEEIQSFLSQADIFILPSLQEASPYGLLEAMASGLPCIATSVGDVSEWIQPEINGLLVPPGDISALATAIGSLLETPSDWSVLGQAAADSVRIRHHPDHIFSAILNEYKQAISFNRS